MGRATDAGIAYGEIEAAAGEHLWIASVGGYCGVEATVRIEGLPLNGTPREVRAALLGRAEEAFEALEAAGLRLARQPDLEFPSHDYPRLLVRFSVTRA